MTDEMENRRPLVLVGCGRIGRVALEICRETGTEVAGFVADGVQKGALVDGCRVLGPVPLLDDADFVADHAFVIAAGDAVFRWRAYQGLVGMGARLPALIHPFSAIAATATIAEGALIQAFVSVYPGARVGPLAMLEDHVSVGVDVRIGKNVVLAPGVTLAAQAAVGHHSFLGVGVVMKPETRVGSGCVIGAGAAVVSDIPDGSIAAGVPARVLRPNPINVDQT